MITNINILMLVLSVLVSIYLSYEIFSKPLSRSKKNTGIVFIASLLVNSTLAYLLNSEIQTTVLLLILVGLTVVISRFFIRIDFNIENLFVDVMLVFMFFSTILLHSNLITVFAELFSSDIKIYALLPHILTSVWIFTCGSLLVIPQIKLTSIIYICFGVIRYVLGTSFSLLSLIILSGSSSTIAVIVDWIINTTKSERKLVYNSPDFLIAIAVIAASVMAII